MQGWTLPTTVTVGGKPYAVHTDYRDILDIIDHLQNTDDNEQERWYIAMALFYENWRDIPAQNRQEAAERMAEFIACGKTQGKPGAKREIDWQQDAELIRKACQRRYQFEKITMLDMRGLASFYAGDHGLIVAFDT